MDEKLKTVSKYFLVIIILFFLFYFISEKVGFRNIYHNLRELNPVFLGLAFLCSVFYMLAWSLRENYLLNSIKKIKLIPMIPIFLLGIFVNTITPSARVGGEPLKAYHLSKRFKISKTKALASLVSNLVYNFMVFFCLCIFSILFVILYIEIDIVIKGILIFFLFSFPFLILILFFLKKRIKNMIFKNLVERFYHFSVFNRIRDRFETSKKLDAYINRKLKIFLRSLNKSFKRKRDLFFAIGLTLIYYLFRLLTVYVIFVALGQEINFISVIVVITLSVFLGDLSLLPGGIGITEGIMVGLYIAFGINPAIAVLVTFIDRTIEYFYSLFLGGICFVYITLCRKR